MREGILTTWQYRHVGNHLVRSLCAAVIWENAALHVEPRDDVIILPCSFNKTALRVIKSISHAQCAVQCLRKYCIIHRAAGSPEWHLGACCTGMFTICHGKSSGLAGNGWCIVVVGVNCCGG